MNKEINFQYNLFTGELEDCRSAAQRRADRMDERPQQTEMFAQREVAQFGVRSRPQMSLSPHTKLVLVSEDNRSEEEIEQDRMRTAWELTPPIFADDTSRDKASFSIRVRSRGIVGYRKRQRQQIVCYSKSDVSRTG